MPLLLYSLSVVRKDAKEMTFHGKSKLRSTINRLLVGSNLKI